MFHLFPPFSPHRAFWSKKSADTLVAIWPALDPLGEVRRGFVGIENKRHREGESFSCARLFSYNPLCPLFFNHADLHPSPSLIPSFLSSFSSYLCLSLLADNADMFAPTHTHIHRSLARCYLSELSIKRLPIESAGDGKQLLIYCVAVLRLGHPQEHSRQPHG